MLRKSTASLLLRVGVAFAFFYPAFAAMIDPSSWIGYFPKFVRGVLPDDILLQFFGLTEIVLGMFILFKKNAFIPSLIAALYLYLIVSLNPGQLDILFRDISIFFAALALAVIERNKNYNERK
ncbi:MAG: hypothetical protein M0P76_04360 [Candidatus Pacebacteria bacterium]|jgi:hypothetical protein|nr:hypothetical protein [Candidatus Paceibacterota bacterium]